MRVIVTGGLGFIGSHLVDILVVHGHEVLIIDNLSSGNFKNRNPHAKFIEMDIRHPEINNIFEEFKPEIVYHLAAQIDVQKSISDPLMDANCNISGTISILECCRKSNVQKIIYASSAAVYGNPEYLPVDEKHPVKPLSFYGLSKFTPESYIQLYANQFEFKFTILRYSNVYGERQASNGEGGVVSIFTKLLKSGKTPIIFGSGEQTRDFVYVKDIASANLAAMTRGNNEVLNVSTNQPVSVNKLLQNLCYELRCDCKPIYLDSRVGDILHSVLNNQKIIDILGWEPKYTLDQGLSEMMRAGEVII